MQAELIVEMPELVNGIGELKGSDRKHANPRVRSTLGTWKASTIGFPRIRCRIMYGRTEGKRKHLGRIPQMGSMNATFELDFYRTNKTLLLIRESGSEMFTFNDFLRKNDVH
jgi:hypothetical protein